MNRLLGMLVLVASMILGWGLMKYQYSIDTSHIDESQKSLQLDIPRGASLNQVVSKLSEMGAIEPFWFKLLVRFEGAAAKIQAGEYELSPGMTPRQILDALISGKVLQYAITLVEGETFRQFLEEIHQHPAIEKTLSADLSMDEPLKNIGISEQHPEGLFLPETYFFIKGTTDKELLIRAYHAMQVFMQEAWPQRDDDLPLQSPYEVLILASIVEKETGAPIERPMIAGLFIKRLQIGMKLQTDPTVIYGMGELYKGNIRYRDLRKDTPYNTYTRYGLPPTPIAMPGKDSINAVLHPTIGKSLYFVSRGDGTHVFSETLQQHNQAVDTYQRKRK